MKHHTGMLKLFRLRFAGWNFNRLRFHAGASDEAIAKIMAYEAGDETGFRTSDLGDIKLCQKRIENAKIAQEIQKDASRAIHLNVPLMIQNAQHNRKKQNPTASYIMTEEAVKLIYEWKAENKKIIAED